jgi:hypothetical protein
MRAILAQRTLVTHVLKTLAIPAQRTLVTHVLKMLAIPALNNNNYDGCI